MALALVLVLVVVGSVLFHVLSPWWWTPIASNWGYIDNTLVITFWITGAVFTAVVLFMAYCVYRFRHKEGQPRRLRAGEQQARMLADRRDGARRGGHAGAGAVRLAPVRHRSEGGDRGRGRRPAMAVELPPARRGRQARHLERPAGQSRQSARHQSRRPERPGRRRDRSGRPAPADRQAGQDAAALDRRAARFLRARVPRQDGHDAGHRSPISGSRRRGPGTSRCCAPSCAASATPSCAAWSRSTTSRTTRPGCRSSGPSPS